jgi:truncated hemoglobin YjbI
MATGAYEEQRFKERLAVYPIDPQFKQNNWNAFARGLQIIGVHRNGKQCCAKYKQLVAKEEIKGVTSNMLTSHKRLLESSGE